MLSKKTVNGQETILSEVVLFGSYKKYKTNNDDDNKIKNSNNDNFNDEDD